MLLSNINNFENIIINYIPFITRNYENYISINILFQYILILYIRFKFMFVLLYKNYYFSNIKMK